MSIERLILTMKNSIQKNVKFRHPNIRIILYYLIFSLIFLMWIGVNINTFLKMSGVDFSIFYAASYLGISGHPEMIYNVEIHHQVLESILNRNMPFLLAWFYPPTFLLFVLPLALLPFKYSLYLWITLTFGIFVFVIYKIAPHKLSVGLALAFPGVQSNLLWAQNGFLITSLLGLGIYFIDINPMLSGFMLAMLCYKPQYAFLPIVVLLIGQHWKTLFWFLVFLLSIIVMSILIFGFDIWQTYIENIPIITKLVENDWVNTNGIQLSAYSTIRLLTDNQYLASVVQTILSITVIIIVCYVWKYVKNHYLRNTAICIGIMLITPYILQYDIIMLSLPLAFYSWDIYKNGRLKGEIVLLSLLYFLPIINGIIGESTRVQITPIALIIFLMMGLRRSCYFLRLEKKYEG